MKRGVHIFSDIHKDDLIKRSKYFSYLMRYQISLFPKNMIETLGIHMYQAIYAHLISDITHPEKAQHALGHSNIKTKMKNYLKYENQGNI